MIIIRHMYDEKQPEVSQATGLDCSKSPSLTKQSEKDSADINMITKRYEKTGALPDLIKQDPQYGDFSEVPDFMAAQELILMANAQFAALDAPIRRRFNNDPAEFLGFATNPANAKEMVTLGLATEKPVVATPPLSPPSAVAPGGASPAAGPVSPGAPAGL